MSEVGPHPTSDQAIEQQPSASFPCPASTAPAHPIKSVYKHLSLRQNSASFRAPLLSSVCTGGSAGRTPHLWQNVEADMSYLVFRPDPDRTLTLTKRRSRWCRG